MPVEFKHELIIPNEDLPFKLFLFEGKDGNYNTGIDPWKFFWWSAVIWNF